MWLIIGLLCGLAIGYSFGWHQGRQDCAESLAESFEEEVSRQVKASINLYEKINKANFDKTNSELTALRRKVKNQRLENKHISSRLKKFQDREDDLKTQEAFKEYREEKLKKQTEHYDK